MTARNSRSSFSVRSTMVDLCNSASLIDSRLERPDSLLEGLDFGVAHALTFPVLLDLTLDALEISAMWDSLSSPFFRLEISPFSVDLRTFSSSSRNSDFCSKSRRDGELFTLSSIVFYKSN